MINGSIQFLIAANGLTNITHAKRRNCDWTTSHREVPLQCLPDLQIGTRQETGTATTPTKNSSSSFYNRNTCKTSSSVLHKDFNVSSSMMKQIWFLK
jgi:hypothetical protein